MGSCKCGRRKDLDYYILTPDGVRYLRCAKCGRGMWKVAWANLTVKERATVTHSVAVHESQEERAKYGA